MREAGPAATLAKMKPFERAPLRGESLAGVAFWRPLSDPQVSKFLKQEAPIALRPVMQIIPPEASLWVRVDEEGTGSVLKLAAGARRGRGQLERSIDRLLQDLGATRRAREDSAS